MIESKIILTSSHDTDNVADVLELLFEELHITLGTWHKQ